MRALFVSKKRNGNFLLGNVGKWKCCHLFSIFSGKHRFFLIVRKAVILYGKRAALKCGLRLADCWKAERRLGLGLGAASQGTRDPGLENSVHRRVADGAAVSSTSTRPLPKLHGNKNSGGRGGGGASGQ